MGHQISIPSAVSQPKPFLSYILDPQLAKHSECDKEMQQILPQFSNDGKGSNNETELQFDIQQINQFLHQYFRTDFLKFEFQAQPIQNTSSPLSSSPKRNVIHEWIWKETLQDKIHLLRYNPTLHAYKLWRHYNYDQFYHGITFILSHLLTHYPIMKHSSQEQQQHASEEDPSNWECCICMQNPIDTTLQCGHSFCLDCIHKWNEKSQTSVCPICKRGYEQEEDSWTWESYPLNSKQVIQQLLSKLWRL